MSHSDADSSVSTETDPSFLSDVLTGLAKPQKQLPSKYFYDEEGSRLFDEICELDEYYPTRTEMKIMQDNLADIVRHVGPEALLIEYGSGSSLKTRILLEHLDHLAGYVPIDISRDYLFACADQLRADFPHIDVLPVHADYSSAVTLPPVARHVARRVVYFPGSTIGNFTPKESIEFLKRVSALGAKGGGLLIGVDLKKDKGILEAAYNDARGITAEFNLNLLKRINTELGANFDLSQFRHNALFNEEEGRIEMHLVSTTGQIVTIGGQEFSFAAEETIHTENSYKYTLAAFAAIGKEAGLKVRRVWTDANCLFSVQFLTVE